MEEFMAQDKGRDATNRKKPRRPKWLVMIYLAGDNSLSANSIAIMQELEAALPPSKDVRVVACFDSNTPRPRGARYVEINHRRHMSSTGIPYWDLHNDLVPLEEIPGHPVEAPDFCNPDPTSVPPTVEPEAKEGLARFLEFALSKHKADRYMLILFGHGSAVAGNTFLADNNPPSFLRLKDFAAVLAKSFGVGPDGRRRPKLDILACDNCMMNGIEAAYEIKGQVNYIVGSQGLVLALGWPFRKIIEKLVRYKNEETAFIADKVLRVCARNLIDFSLMDRSSEQSLCDLTSLKRHNNLVTAVKELSFAMQKSLQPDECGEVPYPPIRDAIKLARLEAQSFWSETFVDLYDFCSLLLDNCNETLIQLNIVLNQLIIKNSVRPADRQRSTKEGFIDARDLPIMEEFGAIAAACREVLKKLKSDFVLASYYIGPELQYSNGVSIYFPWTLPDDPIIFDPVSGSGGGGIYGLSWTSFDRVQKLAEAKILAEANKPAEAKQSPYNYILRTAFDEYETYKFAGNGAGDWSAFLRAFFKATLRNVRRFDVKYVEPKEGDGFFRAKSIRETFPFDPAPINLQKSSSDVDSEMDSVCPTIKNYPRRFYLSPADCLRRCNHPRRDCPPVGDKQDRKLCVSYLGWNIRGIVAEEIGLPPEGGGPKRAARETERSKAKPKREPDES
jgi:hypothetical protein